MNTSQPHTNQDLHIPHLTWGLLLISLLGLFLETLFIRWVGTEIRIFAYLQNTILVVCFLGLGLGMFTSSKPIQIRQSLIPITIFLFLMALPITRSALSSISEMLSSLGDLVIWSGNETSDVNKRIILVIAGLALTYGVLVLIVDTFVPIGRILGRLMNANSNPIWAYSVNILGSILGTWSFVLLSFFYQPPFVWFFILAILLAIFVVWSQRDKRINFFLLSLVVLLSWFASQVPNTLKVIWSPYQKLAVRADQDSWLGNYFIEVNNTGYQAIINLSDSNVSGHPANFPSDLKGLSQYDMPFLFHPDPKSALLVGAGSGNDAAGALRHNLQSVTAVEIDPAIIRIGQEFHQEQPYSSQRVKIINDDARSFFATTTEKYDIISFGLLDSHTTTAMTNARLDHYVYTKESLLLAKSRLNDGGIMSLTFEAQKPFIADRIQIVLEEVFHQSPIMFRIPTNQYGLGGLMFVTGDLGNIKEQLDQNPALAAYIQELQAKIPIELAHNTKVTTDDWPYLYLQAPQIPVLYYLLIVLMILIFTRSYKKWQANDNISITNRTFWHFFFLGAAFLLLEVQNISKASVVLGNTWQVNAVIISSVLAMALLANWIASRFPRLPIIPVYIMLIATCLGLYFTDLARFGFLPYPSKAAIVGTLTSLPMLFSGIIFVRSFTIANDKSNALGANLMGALAGALLQSVTFIFGIKALLLIVASFYFLSLLTISGTVEQKQRAIEEFAK